MVDVKSLRLAGGEAAADLWTAPVVVPKVQARDPPPLFSCTGIFLDLGGREILRDINLHVDPGEVLGIIGPNGAGKTSLFEVLSGRTPPKSGTVTFKGKDVTSLPLHARARLGIGRTYQTPVVPDELTVGETFKAARQAYRPYLTKFDAEYGAELVGLKIDADEPTARLETLNRRKLILACLLMRRPPLLLMDEPAAGLINSEVDEIDHLLRMLSKEMNIAIIIVEHRIELLGTIADRVMVMDAGEVISEGLMKDILDDPKVHAAYFENVDEAG
jgi:branched-chain amino acid transport system ATP-binding protein